MKLPEDVRQILIRRFQNKHREWLSNPLENQWPLEIRLGIPTESAALRQTDGVRAWVSVWREWQGAGTLVWCDRRWQTIGAQRLPEKLVLDRPEDAAVWIGEAARWEQANARYQNLVARWPALAQLLPRYFTIMADYSDADFQRLIEMLSWITKNPFSNLYPRQLPIAGLDSKWLDGRNKLLADLTAAIRGTTGNDRNFYQQCGLKAPPQQIRMRILDHGLRSRIGGLGDIMVPVEDLAALDLSASRVFIVENLQTGLAFSDVPGAIVLMGLGYNVEVLGRLPWIARAQCIYWGDLDTHGFAILHRARSYLPEIQSVLMDEETLLRHKSLWVDEKEQHSSNELSQLTDSEQAIYQSLKQQRWGQNVRLEQERVAWDYAMGSLSALQ